MSGWPLTTPAAVLKPFDPPEQPWGPGHRGVDVQARVGAQVLATAAGRVTYAGRLAGRGVVVVDHGGIRTTYEPVTSTVPVGTAVAAGTPVGLVASGTHCGATPCLHWGLRQGTRYLDPLGQSPEPQLSGAPVRLLPASARGVAQRRAAVRAAARIAGEALAGLAGVPGSTSGQRGFLRPVSGAITSAFGRRFHPVLHVWKLHDGTDYGAACGAPIRAPHAGVVTRRHYNAAYGNRLFVDHGVVDGRHVLTSYNHASGYDVSVGTQVSRGQLLGRVGATGYATGCHLHLMVWLDHKLTNPTSWL